MLSLAKLGRGSEGYYLDAVAKGAEDYYVGGGEAPAYWAGRGAELLGLDGEVAPEALRAILAGTTPDGSMLGAGNRTVPGFDLTFSVPKSVSVLAALRPELSEQIVDACEIAVARSIAWLEDNACFSRRGHNGVEHVEGDGYVAAAFRHRTSRAGDPQLHWHVLVANTTRGPDGRWRTLDGTRVYPALRTAGFLFEAEMRHELTNRFGVRWRPARNGISEIDGAPPAVLRPLLHAAEPDREPTRDQGLLQRPGSAGRGAQHPRPQVRPGVGPDPARAVATRSRVDRLRPGEPRSAARPSPADARARRRDPDRAEPEGTDAQEVNVHSSRRAARPGRAGHRRSNDRRGRAGHFSASRRPGSGRPRRRHEWQRGCRTAFRPTDRPVRSLAATRPASSSRWNNGSSTSRFGAARHLARISCPRSRSSCSPPSPDHPTSSAPPCTASSPASGSSTRSSPQPAAARPTA